MWVVVLVVGVTAAVRAAPPRPVVWQTHRERRWDTQDGLPDNTINTILQTRDGYLWLGTDRGLARFDGVDFEVFDAWNTGALHSERISALAEDADGGLWIGTKGGGLSRLVEGRFSHVGLSSQFITALCGDREGRVWAATAGGGVFVFDEGEVRSYTASSGLPDLFVLSLMEGAEGAMWVGMRDAGLARIVGDRCEPLPLGESAPPAPVRVLCAGPEGRWWAGTAAGLWVGEAAGGRLFTQQDGLPDDQVQALAPDGAGGVWIGTRRGAVHWRAGGAESAGTAGIWLAGESVTAACLDREGNVWLGTEGAGLVQLARMPVASLTARQGLSHETVQCVLEDRTGRVWLGTAGGLNCLSNRWLYAWGPADGLAQEIVTALFEDRRGRVWIGTQGGVSRWEEGRLVKCPASEGWPQSSVWAFLEDEEGGLWMGTSEGLWRRGPEGTARYGVDDGLPSNDIRALARAPDGRMWIGTAHGLAYLESGRFRGLPMPEALLARIILCLHVDGSGDLWCGTLGGGLLRVHHGRLDALSVRDGLPDNTILQVLEDGRNRLWLTTRRGLFRVAKAWFEQRVRGQKPTVPGPQRYGEADGLPSDQCRGFAQPAGWRSRDGRLWVPTLRGVGVIDPDEAPVEETPPPVVIKQVLADNELLPVGPVIRVGPGRERLEFRFVALSFRAPERLRFRYRLEGFEADWTDAGTRRVAYYTRVPPGTYRFRAAVTHPDGRWPEQETTAAVVVLPYFWETAWFRFGVVGLLALTVLSVHRWRVARVRSLERLRLRIARDLHDEVGSNLSSIVLLSRMAPPPVPEELADIRRVAEETIEALRDLVWLINPEHDRMGHVIARMEETARTMLRGVEYAFHCEGVPREQPLSLACRQNLLPVFKEILHNAIRHGRPRRVEIRLAARNRRLELSVRDDGVGFDPATARPGDGLRNFQRRAAEMGGTIDVESAPGRGTTVTLRFPLP